MIATAGTIGTIIPPSVCMVVYAVAANASVTSLFTAGFPVGIITGVALCLYAYFSSKRRGYRPVEVHHYTAKEVWHIFIDAIPALMIPVLVLGSIYGGICTPTEAAAFACMYERYLSFDPQRDRDNEISVQCHAAFVAAKDGIRKASQAGVLVGWGTDQTMQEFLEMPGREFVARAHMGLSNVELLKQATINSAKIVRQDDLKGTVKVGKLADLIVVDGDPVADISLMNREPAHVLKSGKRVIL